MARSIDDGVVPFVGKELLGGAGNGHTTLALLLLPVHVEGEGEGGLAKVGGLFLELLELTLGDTWEEIARERRVKPPKNQCVSEIGGKKAQNVILLKPA